MFGVILGTGVGGGITINKSLLSGPNAICGEWGHNPLPWPNSVDKPFLRCYCGKQGCIETFLSGPGFELDYFSACGIQKTSKDIVQGMPEDQHARHSLERYTNRLSRSLASVINILDPDIIVLGGGMSNIQPIYNQVRNEWHKYVFSDKVNTKIFKARHGDSSGVRGAAWLWPENNGGVT